MKKIYEFIIKYNKRPHLKISPKAPKFIEPALGTVSIWWFVDRVIVVGHQSICNFWLLGFSWWILVTVVGLGCSHNGWTMGWVNLDVVVTCLWVKLAVVVGICSCWWHVAGLWVVVVLNLMVVVYFVVFAVA